MELVDQIVVRHSITVGMLHENLPEALTGSSNHTFVDDHNKKLVKVSDYNKFAGLCRDQKNAIGHSELIAYILPHLSLSDARNLGVSMGDLVCEGVVYTIGNKEVLEPKKQRSLSIGKQSSIASDLLCEVKAKGRPKAGPDLEWYALNCRHASNRYISSLMRTGTDKEVHDAIKACFNKAHTEIYGDDKGFDEWCHYDASSVEKIEYTEQKLATLRNRYMAEHPDALDPVEERKNLLAARGQFTQKKIENELRGELISLTQSFENEIKQLTIELRLLTEAQSLAGYKL